jgi:hypothetical protein
VTDIATFATRWGWGITLLAGTIYFLAKNWQGLADRLASLFPFWERRQMSKIEHARFELEQRAKAADLSFEEQERRDTIITLKETLQLLNEDKKQAQRERKELQEQLLAVVKVQARREAEITAALQGLARVVVLQTDRLTALTSVIEKIVGVNNR